MNGRDGWCGAPSPPRPPAPAQVTLVNTPDIMQKYLGESEKMVRSYFEPAGQFARAVATRHACVWVLPSSLPPSRGRA